MWHRTNKLIRKPNGTRQNQTHTNIAQQYGPILCLCEKGDLDAAMNALYHIQTIPSDTIYLSLLKSCNKKNALLQVERVYEHLVQHNVVVSRSLGNYLVMMLAKCGCMENAWQVFQTLSHRTVFSWTAIISAYVDSGQDQEALTVYREMRDDGVLPDGYTFVSLLKACTNMLDLRQGKKLHLEAEMHGFASDLFVCNTLISMYGKCKAIKEAEEVFLGMPEHNVVSWSVMLSAYVEERQAKKALQLYRQMQEEGVHPDQRTFLFTVQACTVLAEKELAVVMQRQVVKAVSLEIGRALHADIRTKGFSSDLFVNTALLGMYGKCQALLEAEDVLSVLPERNLIAWNAMLTMYIEHDLAEKVLRSYKKMLEECTIVDDVTFLCMLQACGEIGFLEICNYIHFDIVSAGYEQILPVAATLIHAYGSSASIADAQSVFDSIFEPHIPSWNATIAGHAGEGNIISGIDALEKMKLTGKDPDDVTFILILSACSHSGRIGQGIECFQSMSRDYSLKPDLRHYGILANLLGRAGNFRSMERMLKEMPMEPNANIWLCLLGSCHTHGNLVLAKLAFNEVVRLQPKHATPYVLMSNIYANAGLQKCALEVEKCRKKSCGKDSYMDVDDE